MRPRIFRLFRGDDNTSIHREAYNVQLARNIFDASDFSQFLMTGQSTMRATWLGATRKAEFALGLRPENPVIISTVIWQEYLEGPSSLM